MKHFAVLTFALVAALCIIKSHGVTSCYGFKGFHDKLLHKEYIMEGPKWFRKSTRDVKFPPAGYFNPKIITSICATDQTGGRNISTGYASLSEGGPGSKSAVVHIKSARGGSLNFTVEFYGYP